MSNFVELNEKELEEVSGGWTLRSLASRYTYYVRNISRSTNRSVRSAWTSGSRRLNYLRRRSRPYRSNYWY